MLGFLLEEVKVNAVVFENSYGEVQEADGVLRSWILDFEFDGWMLGVQSVEDLVSFLAVGCDDTCIVDIALIDREV